jgi:hypothetical protein
MAVMVVPFTTTMSAALGAGPVPFSKARVAPDTNPEPVIVTFTDEPDARDAGEMSDTTTGSVTVTS